MCVPNLGMVSKVQPISGDKQYHIACGKGDLAEYLLVPGNPDRVPKIAKFWESAKEVSCNREFRSFTGKYKGVPISALSSGIGPACMAIVVNEASRIGVHTFIRVGSTGAIQRGIDCGDVVISSAAVRLDYTSNCYVMPEYPAVASYEVLLALIEAAESLGIGNYHVGITATTADFYAGQNRPTVKGGSARVGGLNNCVFEVFVGVLWFGFLGFYGERHSGWCFLRGRRGVWGLVWVGMGFNFPTLG